MNFVVLHLEKSLHDRGPFDNQSRNKKIIPQGTKSIFLQKGQKKAEPDKNHEMESFEH